MVGNKRLTFSFNFDKKWVNDNSLIRMGIHGASRICICFSSFNNQWFIYLFIFQNYSGDVSQEMTGFVSGIISVIDKVFVYYLDELSFLTVIFGSSCTPDSHLAF